MDVRAIDAKTEVAEAMGWTVLHLFNEDGYTNHGLYQLPLYQNEPTKVCDCFVIVCIDCWY